MEKALSHEERVNVYNSIIEKEDEIVQAINDAIDKSLRNKDLEAKIQNRHSKCSKSTKRV